MTTAPPRPSLRDLLLRSDFGRHDPARIDELLDRCVDPVLEDRPTAIKQERSRAA